MKIGDLVKYRNWYKGHSIGVIIGKDDFGFFLVQWLDGMQWEDNIEIEVINENR